MLDADKVTLLKEFAKRGDFLPLRNVCRDKTLVNEQLLAVVYALLAKRLLINASTGLGKTVIGVSLINTLLTKGDKALFILKRTTLESMLPKVRSMLRADLRCTFVTNQGDVIYNRIAKGSIHTNDVLVISSDCLQDKQVNDYLFDIRDSIKIVIVDEMHLYSNLVSVESRLMDKIVQVSEYAIALTATPFERSIEQVINTAFMLDPSIFKGRTPRMVYNSFCIYGADKKVKGYSNLPLLRKMLTPIMLSIQRTASTGNTFKTCKIHLVEPKKEWLDLKAFEAVSVIKSDTTGAPFYKLVELLDDYVSDCKKGLIYINRNAIKRAVYKRLTDLGFKVGVIDGEVSKEIGQKDKEITAADYLDGKYDILITNIPMSRDLEGDFVIFYESTNSYIQMIGRLHRTFEDKHIKIDMIFAKSTYEEQQFKTCVYPRIKSQEIVCDKDVSELDIALGEIGVRV